MVKYTQTIRRQRGFIQLKSSSIRKPSLKIFFDDMQQFGFLLTTSKILDGLVILFKAL